MGGTRAKFRRRLKRQANVDEGVAVAAGTGHHHKSDQVVVDHRVNKAVDGTPSITKSSPLKEPVMALKAKSKKPKVKKPKHLKRKLEALGGEDASGGEKERLLKEMQTFQENKKKFQKNSKQTTKQDNTSKSNEKKQHKESESFPRRDDNDEEVNPFPRQEPERHNDPEVSTNVEHEQQQDSPNNKNDDGDDNDDDDDDSEATPKDASTRQRGKRRRGRKDTSQQVQEQQQEQTTTEQDVKGNSNQVDKDKDSAKPLESLSSYANPNKKRQKTQTNDNRYCKGRKPVTDFVLGQSYAGKVVYVKPFGIFLDIGCHSDAFCHVSRLQDDYVESAESLFQPGDMVQAARVIEINRARKRITVSLQSRAMREMELQSIEARKGRKEKREERTTSVGSGKSRKKASLFADTVRSNVASNSEEEQTTVKETGRKDSLAVQIETKNTHACSEQTTTNHSTIPLKMESEMSPAEFKRARKLARRAARRAKEESCHRKELITDP